MRHDEENFLAHFHPCPSAAKQRVGHFGAWGLLEISIVMLEWTREEAPDATGIGLKDRISRGDISQMIPRIEKLIERSGKAKVLLELTEIHGIRFGKRAIFFRWKNRGGMALAQERSKALSASVNQSSTRRMKMAEPMTEKIENKARESVRRLDQAMPEPGTEGRLTHKLETQTSRIPSLAFVGLAMASMVGSAAAEFLGDKKMIRRRGSNLGTFIGLWAPTFLLLGIYNKLVKVSESSDLPGKSRQL